KLDFPLTRDGHAFSAQVKLEELGEARPGSAWDLSVVGGSTRSSVAVADEAACPVARLDGSEFALERSREGAATLVAHVPQAVVTEASWVDDGVLEVHGERAPCAGGELVLYNRHRLE